VQASYGHDMASVVPMLAPVAALMEFASSVAGTLLVMTGAGAGCFRAWAVLAGKPAVRINWWTAFGFLFGGLCMILIVCIDRLSKVGW
jgi:hypothetical protein